MALDWSAVVAIMLFGHRLHVSLASAGTTVIMSPFFQWLLFAVISAVVFTGWSNTDQEIGRLFYDFCGPFRSTSLFSVRGLDLRTLVYLLRKAVITSRRPVWPWLMLEWIPVVPGRERWRRRWDAPYTEMSSSLSLFAGRPEDRCQDDAASLCVSFNSGPVTSYTSPSIPPSVPA